jgi:putative DNA methylase
MDCGPGWCSTNEAGSWAWYLEYIGLHDRDWKSMNDDRRLIEDFLPVDTLNEIASKEKKHPKHPVALVHYWPARRPITACRAAIYATLVPAPKNEVDRQESAAFVEKLASFNLNPKILMEARERIRAYYGHGPKILDLFAGGGAIPLEAARLGCESHALEYNPVAHLIELCTLVYPQRFGQALARDLEHWGGVVLERVSSETELLYPKVQLSSSKQVMQQVELFGDKRSSKYHRGEQQPVAFIWVRAVPCRKPGCPAIVPLVRQAWLRKKGLYVAAFPKSIGDGSRLRWEIASGRNANQLGAENDEQTGAGDATCLVCTTPATIAHVKECATSNRMSEVLAAVVVDGGKSKLYLPPDAIKLPSEVELDDLLLTISKEAGFAPPDEPLQGKLRDQVPAYGFERFRDLFTTRQLVVLMSLAKNIRQVHQEMCARKMEQERARAITTYLGMAFGRLLNSFTKFCRWQGQDQKTIAAIGDRQALKMVYDFSEINPFAETAGCLPFALENEVYSIAQLADVGRESVVLRGNAEAISYEDESFDAVITDPPYYSSIFYADLSSFFYVWLRRMVGDIYREHFVSPLPPKLREAVAQASEHEGDSESAEEHYREVMEKSFIQARRVLKPGGPLVCVYAHRTTEGWASLINALVPAGLMVSEAWPLQTEAKGRTNSLQAATLSDSVFFVARRRESNETGQYEAEVRPEVDSIARERVSTLWADGRGIGGADLLMATVGACLRPYTQFGRVEYANGDVVSSKHYLREVEGVVLEAMLERLFGISGSNVSAVDPLTRFYILWRFTYRESDIESGEAIVFCYPQDIELDGPNGISGASPALVEKVKGTYRVRNFQERGSNKKLGLANDGSSVALIDVLHRVLWLQENSPREISTFLQQVRPNVEQLRLVAESLCKPILKGSDTEDRALTPELSALTKLTANWRSVIEDRATPLFSS